MVMSHPLAAFLLLDVPTASPVSSNSNSAHSHQEDDHHVVVQHWLAWGIHGHLPALVEGLPQQNRKQCQNKKKV